MKQTNPTKSDIAREYVEKYIALGLKNNCGYSKRFISKVMHSEHKDRFKDDEDARNFIRLVTHSRGVGRNYKKDEELKRKFALIAERKQGLVKVEPIYKEESCMLNGSGYFYNGA